LEGNLQKYICSVCGYIYNPANGDKSNAIKAGTSFENIPKEWVCPVCGVKKNNFSATE